MPTTPMSRRTAPHNPTIGNDERILAQKGSLKNGRMVVLLLGPDKEILVEWAERTPTGFFAIYRDLFALKYRPGAMNLNAAVEEIYQLSAIEGELLHKKPIYRREAALRKRWRLKEGMRNTTSETHSGISAVDSIAEVIIDDIMRQVSRKVPEIVISNPFANNNVRERVTEILKEAEVLCVWERKGDSFRVRLEDIEV